MSEIITMAKKAADAWRNTDTYHQAAQIIDMLVEELERKPTLTPPEIVHCQDCVHHELDMHIGAISGSIHVLTIQNFSANMGGRKMAVRPIDGERLKGVIQQWIDTQSEFFDTETCESVLNAIDVLPTLTPPNEWISVEDRLPPKKQNVLAYSPESGVAEADYGDGFWVQYRWSAVMRGVTHWMPLPEAPDSRPPEGEET